MRWWLAVAVMLLVPASVSAQVPDVDNPTGASWTCSTDHANAEGYGLDLLRPDGTVLQSLTFTGAAKPTPSGANECTVSLNVQPIAFGTGYGARVRTVAGTAFSGWEPSQNKFNRIPGRPGGPRLIAVMMRALPADLG